MTDITTLSVLFRTASHSMDIFKPTQSYLVRSSVKQRTY